MHTRERERDKTYREIAKHAIKEREQKDISRNAKDLARNDCMQERKRRDMPRKNECM